MSNMVVRTNVLAINSHRNLGLVGTQQARASARLSSGFRVNSAADDAAGLSISEGMRAQIRGMNQAARNAQDGISLIQTAEGFMQTITEMVQKAREMAVQASTDTYSPENRDTIASEISQLRDEIERIWDSATFNGQQLFRNAAVGPATPIFDDTNVVPDEPFGALQNNTVPGTTHSVSSMNVLGAGALASYLVGNTASATTHVGAAWTAAEAAERTGTNVAFWDAANLGALNAWLDTNAAQINTDKGNADTVAGHFTSLVSGLNDVTTAPTTTNAVAVDLDEVAAWLNDPANQTVIAGTGTVNLTAAQAAAITDQDEALFTGGNNGVANLAVVQKWLDDNRDSLNAAVAAAASAAPGTPLLTATLNLQVGPDSGNRLVVDVTSQVSSLESRVAASTAPLGNWVAATNNHTGWTAVITNIGDTLTEVNDLRAALGAYQNRLEFTVENLNISSENLSAAESRIRDADMAAEMMRLTQANVLQQAATAMLAQANQAPQSILQLLG